MPPGGTRPLKRLIAPSQQNQPAGVQTRQRTKDFSLTKTDGDRSLRNEEVPTRSPRRNCPNHEERPQPVEDIDVTTCAATHEAADFPTQSEEHTQLGDEDAPIAKRARGNRGNNMGKGLERISRGLCTKIPIQIVEGKTRPEAPMQAAKLASEGGIILRQHVAILPHWKEYKKDKSVLEDYIGKVAGQFTMDTNSKAVKTACMDMLKGGQRQMRHRLKKRYFEGVPANQVRTTSPVTSMTDEQWRNLVQMWSNPKHKDTSEKNKLNREKVQFQQRTGSRSYIAHVHAIKEKYKDEGPTAIDLFKECHNSKKSGFSEPVKKAIADMEAIMDQPVPEGQEPKSATTVVCDVLSQICPTTKFLQNVGLQSACKNSSKGVVASLQAELELERKGAAELRDKVNSQQQELDALKKQVEEAEVSSNKHAEEFELLKKRTDETEAILRGLLSFSRSQVNPSP